jgi:hypothetical protein
MNKTNLTLFLVGVCLSALLSAAVTSTAEDTELDSGPRVIPYAGLLDLAGVPYEGTADIRVTLSDGDTQSWQEDHEDVQVSDGHYEVAIGGAGGDLPAWVFTASQVYARFWLREGFQTQEEDFVPLSSGVHGDLGVRLDVSPMAYWSAQGNDLHVSQRITVGGDATVTGETTLYGADGLALPSGLTLGSGALELGAGASLLLEGSSLALTHEGDGDAGALTFEGSTNLVYGDNSLQMRRGFSQAGQEVSAGALVVQGDFTAAQQDSTGALLEVEQTEYELTTSDGLQAVNMGTTTRRACFLTLLSIHDGAKSCHVIEEDGEFLLTSTSQVDNTQTDSFCRARCLAW